MVPSSRNASASTALDVPPRATRAPHRVPRRLVGRRRLPQDEVQPVALVGVVDVTAAVAAELEHALAK